MLEKVARFNRGPLTNRRCRRSTIPSCMQALLPTQSRLMRACGCAGSANHELLNERVGHAVSLVKSNMPMAPIYDPTREAQVMAKIKALNLDRSCLYLTVGLPRGDLGSISLEKIGYRLSGT